MQLSHPTHSMCPICAGSSVLVFSQNHIPIHECSACVHRFAAFDVAVDHIQQTYSDDYFFAGGAGYSNYLASESIVRGAATRYAKLITSSFEKSTREIVASDAPKSIFSIGTAAGFDLAVYRELGWTTEGLEPNATMVAHARDRLQLNVHHGSLEDFRVTKQYDVVTAIQVMAHFTNIQRAAEQMAKMLHRHGILVVETWNFRSWTARLLGKNWHEYSPPSVLQWFSPQSLDRLLEGYGLHRIRLERPGKQIRGDHARGLLEFKLSSVFPKRLASIMVKPIPAKMAIPYPAEDLFFAIYSHA